MVYDITPRSRGFAWTPPKIRHVDPRTTPALLLAGEGVFPMDEVVAILKIGSSKIKAEADRLFRAGEDPFTQIGVTCIQGSWVIEVARFGTYFRGAMRPRVRSIIASWNGNELLRQTGVFLLRDVCRLIPFTANQLRYQAQKNPDSRHEYGIWKDDELDTYVVDMDLFGEWISRVWIDQVKSR